MGFYAVKQRNNSAISQHLAPSQHIGANLERFGNCPSYSRSPQIIRLERSASLYIGSIGEPRRPCLGRRTQFSSNNSVKLNWTKHRVRLGRTPDVIRRTKWER